MYSMKKGDIFEWLVKYHCEHNLELCLAHIQNGTYRSPITGKPLDIGFEENDAYKGILVVANGDKLLNNMIQDGIAKKQHVGDISGVANEKDFFDYINRQRNSDGAYLFDSVNQRIARAYLLNNSPKSLDESIDPAENRLPNDFLSNDSRIDSQKEIGTKTRLALTLTLAYEGVEAFQIKRTAYAPSGLGKVTHFNKDGLYREFFFDYSESEGIYGVYRRYAKENGTLKCIEEKIVPIEEIVGTKEKCVA